MKNKILLLGMAFMLSIGNFGCVNTSIRTEVTKQSYTLKYKNLDETVKIKGKYTGQIYEGKPDGEGKFVSNKGKDVFYYKGEWKNGKLVKKGKLTFDNMKIEYVNSDDSSAENTGSFVGETVRGVPEGEGTFTAQNDEGTKWSYDGGFKNGKFDGHGTTKWEDGLIEEGTYTAGQFTPTPCEFFVVEGTNTTDTYTTSEKAKEFMNSHADYFLNQTYDASDIDSSFSFLQYKKTSPEYGDKLISTQGLKVIQISEYKYNQYPTVTFAILENTNDTSETYQVYMLGATDALEGDVVNLVGLPLAYFTYKNVENEDIWAMAVAGVTITK